MVAAPDAPASGRYTAASPSTEHPDPEHATLREPANRVSPTAKPMWMAAAAASEVIPLAGIAVWMSLDPEHRSWQWPILALLLIAALVHVVVMPLWRYRVHRWEVTNEAVYTQTGWVFQERRIAPISRIQTVDAQYGPIERMFGLGTMVVTTASAAGPLRVSGLERPTVERLVAELTTAAGVVGGDAT